MCCRELPYLWGRFLRRNAAVWVWRCRTRALSAELGRAQLLVHVLVVSAMDSLPTCEAASMRDLCELWHTRWETPSQDHPSCH